MDDVYSANRKMAKEIETLRAENERLRRDIDKRKDLTPIFEDAERYRFLLKNEIISYLDFNDETHAHMDWVVGPSSLTPQTLDAAIDEAMKDE